MTNHHTIPLKPFYFIRHGQTDWNREHRLMGQTDIPLNEHGINQAQEAASYFKKSAHLIEKIISSPLLRSKKTAQIIGNTLNLPITYCDGLKEVSFGVAEGELESYENYHTSWVKGNSFNCSSWRCLLSNRRSTKLQNA
jgi:broad specificity phosphatase PhoE